MSDTDSITARPRPVRNTVPRVKRNQSCPCGSGKKTKYCCLGRIKEWANLNQKTLVERAIDRVLTRTETTQGATKKANL